QNPRPGTGEKSQTKGKRRTKTDEAAPGFDL
ncbi:MAG: hypothetical protein RL268_1839, partial [Pseudomonadota bacterium]